MREQALEALHQECRADGTDPARLSYLLAGRLAPLFEGLNARQPWQEWRYGQVPDPDRYAAQQGLRYYHSHAGYSMPDPTTLPQSLVSFEQQLQQALLAAGFTMPAAGLPAVKLPAAPPTTSKPGLLDALRNFFR